MIEKNKGEHWFSILRNSKMMMIINDMMNDDGYIFKFRDDDE